MKKGGKRNVMVENKKVNYEEMNDENEEGQKE